MKVIPVLLLSLFAAALAEGQIQQQWSKKYGNSHNAEIAYDVAGDKCGNIYSVGFYQEPVEFGNITSPLKGIMTGFILKSDAVTGDVKSLFTVGDDDNSVVRIMSVKTDDSCNVYIAGQWTGGSIALENTPVTGSEGSFIAKLNEAGNVKWIRTTTAFPFGLGYIEISLGPNREVILTGSFSGTATFGSTNITAQGTTFDVFVAAYTNNGSLTWAKKFGGSGDNIGNAVDVDANGNIYITGSFTQTISFDNKTLTTNDNPRLFTAKLNSSGDVIWAIAGTPDSRSHGYGVAVDGSGNVYVAGNTSRYILIKKLNANGDSLWAITAHSTGFLDPAAQAVKLDKNGEPYITGHFYGDLQMSNVNHTGEFHTGFVAGFTSSGGYKAIKLLTGPYREIAHGMGFSYNKDAIFIAGEGSEGNATSTADVQITKFNVTYPSTGIGENTLLPAYSVTVSPNPAQNFIKLKFESSLHSTYSFTLLDANGRIVLVQDNIKEEEFLIELGDVRPGVYFYRIYSEVSGNSGKLLVR